MDKYISREAVFQVVHGIARGIADRDIEALKAKDMKTLYKIAGAKEILDSVDTDLCYIPAADVQPVDRWISVNDRLPEINERVLVYIPKPDNHYNTEIAYLSEGNDNYPYWVLRDKSQFYSTRLHYISRWMPLPEPPKDGDAE